MVYENGITPTCLHYDPNGIDLSEVSKVTAEKRAHYGVDAAKTAIMVCLEGDNVKTELSHDRRCNGLDNEKTVLSVDGGSTVPRTGEVGC